MLFKRKNKKKLQKGKKEVIAKLEGELANENIEARFESRIKSLHSVREKAIRKRIHYSQILDELGLRLIVKEEKDCYRAMTIVVEQFPQLMPKVKDYIALPNENGYRSLHLTVYYNDIPVEIQIRTDEMHNDASEGAASKYKTT